MYQRKKNKHLGPQSVKKVFYYILYSECPILEMGLSSLLYGRVTISEVLLYILEGVNGVWRMVVEREGT